MLASVIIPVYKRSYWLEKALWALRGQEYGDEWEVIVVDDGSPNEASVREAFERVAVGCRFRACLKRKPNGGPASARNFGARSAQGTLLCFLDDDSVAQPGWLESLSAPFKKDGRVGLVSGKTLSYERHNDFPLLLERTVYSGKCWATCNIGYRRKVFDRLGGFDETFPEPSWEDNDLGLRALWAGYSHAYSEKAVVLHPHERSLAEYRKKCLLNGRGMAVFCKKYWRSKPIWSFAAPFIMSRRLICALSPFAWTRRHHSGSYIKFLWSFYSLQGFAGALLGNYHGKNQAR